MRSTWRAPVVEPQQALLSVVLLNVALVGLTIGLFWAGVFVARSFGGKVGYSLAPLGFTRPRGGLFAGIGVGVAVGVGAVIASIPVNLATTFVLDRLGYSTERAIQGPFMRGLFHWVQESPDTAIPAIILVVMIFGPAVEELVFRGALFNGLYRLGRLILCVLFERTGSLLPTFVAHATFNSFAVSLIILAGLGVFELPI